MPNIRLLPPSTGALSCTVNGRTYTGVIGATLDVPDFDAQLLTANGWTISAEVGTTALRPTLKKEDRGRIFLDTTLVALIRWDGKTWRDKITGAAV